jgi:hypothetical protein
MILSVSRLNMHLLQDSSVKNTIAGWDPRGVGITYPRADCFESEEQEHEFWRGTILGDGIEARGQFEDDQDLRDYYKQVPKVDGLLVDLGKKCLDYSPDTLRYVGTAATVRDMVALHDHLERSDKLLNYWGIS